jgi:thiamine biosynthesis protein ThiI
MQRMVMVRYGELFLKSDSVMQHYIRLLIRNLGKALNAEGLNHTIEEHRGRIYINCDEPDRVVTTAAIFGIVATSVADRCEPTMDALAETAVQRVKQSGRRSGRFAVRARRDRVPGFSSQELGAYIGSAILDVYPDFSVDLTNPEYEIFVEARTYGGFVTDLFHPGPGGLPLGTQGRAICLLSAGIDSPVAAWLMMRRGTELILLHMNGGRYAGAATRDDALRHAATLSQHCKGMEIRIIEVPMEPFFSALETLPEVRYRCVLCKRFMHRVASLIGEEQGCMAIINGDNLGQVASQTLENLATVSMVATLPILRPLITYDKGEVVDLAKKIRTFIARPGDHTCRMVPKRPATQAKIMQIEEEEAKLPMDALILEAIRGAIRMTALSGSISNR